MRVLIKKEIYEMPVYSIYTTNDPRDRDNRQVKMFFCWNCQAPVTQYIGMVSTVVAGEPILRLGQITKCKNPRCNMVYCFREIS